MKFSMTRPRLAAVLLTSLVLAACGGGGGGSTLTSAASPSQSANGTVTGFGSVFVDGVELEDAKATTRIENADGSYSTVALQLGQRVRVAYDGNGNASTITVDAAVSGSVAAINPITHTLVIAGQTVQVNLDASTGPVTLYGGGYGAFADIAVGDVVEVHGSPVYDSVAGAYVVKATRIEKESAIVPVRVMGKLGNLNPSLKTFTINGLSVSYAAANVVPTGTTLADGQAVSVWGAPGSLTGNGLTPTLNASRVKVVNPALADSIANGATRFGGVISNYDAIGRSFELEGVRVLIGSAAITPTGAAIANGQWVKVTGAVGSDGSVTATSIRIRRVDDDDAGVRLLGAIESLADQSAFVVRGVPVDAGSATVDASCAAPLAVGTVVSVTATLQVGTEVVLASRVSCPASGTYTMRSVVGTAGSVDAVARTFVLARASGGTQTVQWNDQTYFAGVTADTLAGTSLVVQGYLDASGTLVARKIRNPGSESGHEDSDDYGKTDDGGPRSWSHYRSSHH